jgi:hypothetical protein
VKQAQKNERGRPAAPEPGPVAWPTPDGVALRDPSLPEPRLTRQSRDRLGAALRAAYGELLAQPLPERLRELVERLDGPSAQAKDKREAPDVE